MQPNRQDYGLLLALGAVWGSSFLLIKLAVDTIPPITVATGRIGIGALVLALIVVVRRRAWPRRRREWLLLFAMGVVGNAIPFSLINWGETHIDSGLTAILMSSVPLASTGRPGRNLRLAGLGVGSVWMNISVPSCGCQGFMRADREIQANPAG